MRIIMLGPQGSGKGTQAKMLSSKLNAPHISTGDLLRDEAAAGTELGEKLKIIINSGQLVSDDLIVEMLKQRIKEDDCQSGFILDGFPRNLNQAKLLDQITDIDTVISLEIPDQVAIDRISSRYQCRKCGSIYGLNNPSPEDNICTKCGGEIYQRDDDTPEAVKKRLETYHRETEPLKDYYKERVKKIDGTPKPDVIFQAILQTLGV